MFIKPIILCGGSGTRLWPESRKTLPKQFINFFDNNSLFDLTLQRIKKFNNLLTPIIATSSDYYFMVEENLKKNNLTASLLLEPEPKNTTASIYLAAKFSGKEDLLLIMPSDHLISEPLLFKDKIIKILLNDLNDKWITFGVKPSFPSEAFGYIEVNHDITFNKDIYKVTNFIEKPNLADATKMLENKNFYWNSGIFAGQASMIIKSIQKYAPEIAQACDKAYTTSIKDINRKLIKFDQEVFKKIPSLSIDYSVIEKTKNLVCSPLDIYWDDVGSWDSISKIQKNRLDTKIVEIDSDNNFIRNNGKVIATIGIKDLIIIESKDATLISSKNHTEKVKNVVSELNRRNIIQGVDHNFEKRPWGKFENIWDNEECKVKRIEINPYKRLSLQYHNYRSEHWLVVKGTAKVYLNGKMFTLKKGMSIDIPKKAHHYIENIYKRKLVIIETQIGEYFGEDDIIRLDDPYNR